MSEKVLQALAMGRQPDNIQWTNRFEVESQSTGGVYVISQHKAQRYWGCSCMGWKTRKKCKHLRQLGLPEAMEPYELPRVASSPVRQPIAARLGPSVPAFPPEVQAPDLTDIAQRIRRASRAELERMVMEIHVPQQQAPEPRKERRFMLE